MDHRVEEFLREVNEILEPALRACLEEAGGTDGELCRSMAYTVFAPAKRFRPALALASVRATGGETARAVPLMTALELLHTYSLVHDDLPCMDDDEMRRGQPACHRVFGEGMAVLAGDALQALAFAVLTRAVLEAKDDGAREMRALAEVAQAVGPLGMTAGQAQDLRAVGRRVSPEEVEEIHRLKTGALFLAAVRGGAHLGGARPEEHECLAKYARSLGVAFQAADDLLDDADGSRPKGASASTGLASCGASLSAALGREGAERRARALLAECHEALRPLGSRGELLAMLADYAVRRNH